MYELVIIWETGEKEVYPFKTEEQAEQGGRNMRKAFGKQIEWYGVRKKGGVR